MLEIIETNYSPKPFKEMRSSPDWEKISRYDSPQESPYPKKTKPPLGKTIKGKTHAN